MNLRKFLPRLIAVMLGWVATRASACGPDFPNNILDGGEAAVLTAPIADFGAELIRIHLSPAVFIAQPATNGYAGQLLEVEIADLQSALRRESRTPEERKTIIDAYLGERQKLLNFREAMDTWRSRNRFEFADENVRMTARPVLEPAEIPAGLPAEFCEYLRGCIVWYSGETNAAREAWMALLNLPASERHFRSTWAAFMLGKSWEAEDRDQAMQFHQQVRVLAAGGFSDRLGLAAASLGREALMRLRNEQFEPAIELYLQQLATGDETAVESLRFAAARALGAGNPDVLQQWAANPKTQRVLTAYLVSRGIYDEINADRQSYGEKWLKAVEMANVVDVESAEVLTLAAYRAGDWETAQRWINRAAPTPTVQWIQAKLLLRAGKTAEAAALLAAVASQFPMIRDTNTPPRFEDDLTIPGTSYLSAEIRPREQALAELGALQLSRREYAEALDALVRSWFWMDAAYVAENVLTVDELKTYVDRNWPALVETNAVNETNGGEVAGDSRFDVREALRYLLARRLTRLNRVDEARDYFPARWLPQLEALARTLASGRDETLSYGERFNMLAAAAGIMRTNGMELVGSECEPDWHIFDGNFDWGLTAADRTNQTGFVGADEDEITRTALNRVEPNVRFHYRRLADDLRAEAAELGEQAALSMPDESDEKARLLCRCGTWRAARDPKAAYADFQSILHHCAHTEIGLEAARTGRIPVLDGNGRLAPRVFRAEDIPTPGRRYLVHMGDTLYRIIRILNDAGQLLTIPDLLAANPNLKPNKIRAGQVIDIPFPNHPDDATETPANPDPVVVSSDPAPHGEYYIVQRGDTLAAIVSAVRSLGQPLTIYDLLEVNPGLNPARLIIGEKLFIPLTRIDETGTGAGRP